MGSVSAWVGMYCTEYARVYVCVYSFSLYLALLFTMYYYYYYYYSERQREGWKKVQRGIEWESILQTGAPAWQRRTTSYLFYYSCVRDASVLLVPYGLISSEGWQDHCLDSERTYLSNEEGLNNNLWIIHNKNGNNVKDRVYYWTTVFRITAFFMKVFTYFIYRYLQTITPSPEHCTPALYTTMWSRLRSFLYNYLSKFIVEPYVSHHYTTWRERITSGEIPVQYV